MLPQLALSHELIDEAQRIKSVARDTIQQSRRLVEDVRELRLESRDKLLTMQLDIERRLRLAQLNQDFFHPPIEFAFNLHCGSSHEE
jgi:hypothetical protein